MDEDFSTDVGFVPEGGSLRPPLWLRIIVFPIALFLGVVLGSLAACVVGVCIFITWICGLCGYDRDEVDVSVSTPSGS